MTRRAAGFSEVGPDAYVLPLAVEHTTRCEECSGPVVYVRDGYVCDDCGLIQR